MIKKIIFLVIFVISIIFLYNYKNFKEYTNYTYYDIPQNSSIENINIDINNTTLEIIPTNNNYIKLSRNTLFRRNKNISYSSSYNDNTLNITKYVKGNQNTQGKDKLTLEIPSTSKINNINITGDNSKVSIESIDSKNLKITSKDYLNLQITNATIESATIKADKLNSSLSNSLIKNSIEYDIQKGLINNDIVTGTYEQIKNKETIDYVNNNSRFKTTEFQSKNVNLYFTLGIGTKYEFKYLTETKAAEPLTKEQNTFYYNEKVENIESYIILCNNNKIKKLDLEKREAIRSQDVE